jgi:nucleoside-diphosphate-sugar epimerase
MVIHSNKILITGIDGFTGKYLEEFLIQKGFEVYGTVINKSKNFNYYQCDITKKEQVDKVIKAVKPDYVIHLAAISFVAQKDSLAFYNVNVIGTQNILDSIIDNSLNPKKIILASSATVYGNQGKEVLDESMCPKPINHYGCSKLAMEHISSTYFDKLNIIITRPFNYTGVGQEEHFLIPKIVKHFKDGKKEIELGNIDVAREFNSINYVVEIYYKLLLSTAKSTIVNIASNKAIKLLDIIEIMEKISGHKIKIKVNPAFVRENEIKTLSGSTDSLFNTIQRVKHSSIKEILKEMYLF